MRALLSNAGRSFLRAFLGSFVVLAPGILAAPNLNRAVALGIAAVMASIAAGLRTLQHLVPQLSVGRYILSPPFDAWIDSFVRAFLAAFITSIIGILNMPDLSGAKSLVVGAVIGAITAGLRALEGILTRGEDPLPSTGF
jgi:hypothetical protein